MLDNQKCCVGLKSDGGCVIPHDSDWTDTMQCELPVVAMEKYQDEDGHALPVCVKHRHLVREIYGDTKAEKPDMTRNKLPRSPICVQPECPAEESSGMGTAQ